MCTVYVCMTERVSTVLFIGVCSDDCCGDVCVSRRSDISSSECGFPAHVCPRESFRTDFLKLLSHDSALNKLHLFMFLKEVSSAQ